MPTFVRWAAGARRGDGIRWDGGTTCMQLCQTVLALYEGGRSTRGEERGGGRDKGGEVGGESERRTWTRNASWLQLAVVEWGRQRVANRGGFMCSRAVALGLRRGNEA